MKTHTSGFKNAIKTFGRELDSKITYTINGTTTELGNEELNSVSPHYEGGILKSVMKQLDIDCDREIPIGTILNYQFGVKVGNAYEYISFGDYVVYKVEKQEDTLSYNITCYDKMLYAMKDYETLSITYPITIRNYINAICTHLGLTFKNVNSTFANYDKQIPNELYLDENGKSLGYTFRDVLDELAQVTASTICINETDGQLEVRYITNTNDTIDEEFLKDVNVNFGEKYGAINTIVLSRSAGTDNIYYPSTLPQNPIEIKISDNQIMNRNDRDTYLPDIYNKLNGLEYYINDFSSTGICYYNLCDRYTVQRNNTTYSCVMLNNEINVTQGLEELIYTDMPEEAVTDYTKADKTDRKINQTTLIVDKQQGEITALVESVEDIETPIASTSGSTLYLQDSAETELIDFSLEGDTTQETRSGKNLFDKSKVLLDKALNRNNNNLIDLANYSTSDYCNVLPNTQYYLGIAYSSSNYGIVFYNSNKEYISGQQSQNTFTTPANTYYIRFTWKTADYDINTLQLEQGSTPTSYESFGVMPSPEFPSKLVSVGYENLFDYTTSAFSVPNNVEIIAENNQLTITTTVTTTSNNLFFLTKIPDELLKNGETYTISSENVSGVVQPLLLQLRNKNGSNASKSRASSVVYDDNYSLYVDGNIYATTGSTSIPSGTVAIIKNIQVVKGTQQHSYIPYGKYGVEIKNTGKNLFSSEMELGTINSSGVPSSNNNAIRTKDFIEVLPNTQYTIKNNFDYDNNRYEYDENLQFIKSSLIAGNPQTFTTDERTKYVKFRTTAGNVENDLTSKWQLEKGNQATTYEAYKSNSQLYILDEPVRGIDDYKDLLYIQNGMLYVERKIKRIILNGGENEDWKVQTSKTNSTYFQLKDVVFVPVAASALPPALCSHFIANTGNILNAQDVEGFTFNTSGYLRISVFNTTASTVNGLKTWLSNNNIEVVYIPNEPIIEVIGEVKIPSTYEGVTNIFTTDELEPNMNITYVRDTAIGNYVEGQVNGTKTIEERHYSEIKLTEEGITSRVETTEIATDELSGRMNAVEIEQTSQQATINILGTNIDLTNGEVREVTTTTGFTFNAEGMTISDSDSNFRALHRKDGTYYYDGVNVVGEYTKDGSKQKDLELFGVYTYGKASINSPSMFIAQLYTDSNGEVGFGHFWNSGE